MATRASRGDPADSFEKDVRQFDRPYFPLTGLHNRLKLGPTWGDEMQRGDRYKTPGAKLPRS